MASTHVKLQTFRNYITSQLSPGHPLPQPKGNGKLSRLQEVQFQVLVSDVYDELIRRTQNPSIPHLIARSELNAKRNQAREKLSSLGAKKFFDLVCEVYTELERRRSHAEPPTPPADSPHHPHPSSAGRNGPPMRPPPGPAYGHSHNHGLGPARGPSPGPGSHPRPPRDHYPNSHRQPPPRPALDDSYRPPKPPSMDRQRTYDGPSKENSHAPMPLRSNPSLRSNGSAPSIDSGYYNGGQRPASNMAPNEDVIKMKNDYEKQILSLRQHVEALEISLEQSRQNESKRLDLLDSNNQLSLDLDHYRTKIADLERTVGQLRQENDEFRKEQLEYQKSQRMGSERDREEKDNLRRQIGRLTSELGDIKNQNDHYSKQTKKLMDEKMALERDLRNTKRQLEKLSNQPPPTPVPLEHTRSESHITMRSKPQPLEEGGIDRTAMNDFQAAIDNLLGAGRSTDPAAVLNALKSVMRACKVIVENVERYERQPSLPLEQQRAAKVQRAKLLSQMNNLSTAAKTHAAGRGYSPMSLLEAAANQVNAAIMDLVDTVKLRPNSTAGSLIFSSPSALKQAQGTPSPAISDYRSPHLQVATDMARTGTADLSRPHRQPSNGSTQSITPTTLTHHDPHAGHPPFTPSDEASLSGSTTASHQFGHGPESDGYNPDGGWDTSQRNNGLTVDGLRDFLETKTDQAVQGIQCMLRTSRASEVDPVNLCLNLRQVVSVTSSILATCRTSFDNYGELLKSPHLYPSGANNGYQNGRPPSYLVPNRYTPGEGRKLLQDLADGDERLQSLVAEIYKAAQMAAINSHLTDPSKGGNPMLLNGSSPKPGNLHEFQIDNQDLDTEVVHDLVNDKVFKQRLTSAVFDVAKHTKFLVALME